ncbi:MAG TPA: hypothetical protein VFW46_18720 [Stellaceae bacterium]|nr:hypothetical protein [Stellaceae bacterium]
MRPVTLHVERLVIDCPGMGRAEIARFERAMRAELTRLAGARPGALAGPAEASPQRAARPVALASPAQPVAFGQQVARSLFSALAGGS